MIVQHRKNLSLITLACLVVGISGFLSTDVFVQNHKEPDRRSAAPAPLHVRKQMIASESFETVGVFDVNKDGSVDLVSGAYWYEGPDFMKRVYIGQPSRFDEYYNDFSTIPM